MIGLLLFLLRTAFLLLVVLAFGFLLFWGAMPQPILSQDASADAIVVVTGGSGRIAAAMALLDAGRAPQLFISGVGRGVTLADLLREGGEDIAVRNDLLACCVTLGHMATNTYENGREVGEWAAQNNIKSIILVSSNYHLRRAELEVMIAAPNIEIIPFATDTASTRQWWKKRWTTELMLSEYFKTLWALGRYLSRN